MDTYKIRENVVAALTVSEDALFVLHLLRFWVVINAASNEYEGVSNGRVSGNFYLCVLPTLTDKLMLLKIQSARLFSVWLIISNLIKVRTAD